jgi:hypothetical protein
MFSPPRQKIFSLQDHKKWRVPGDKSADNGDNPETRLWRRFAVARGVSGENRL